MSPLLGWLDGLDLSLLLLVNRSFEHPFLNAVMPALTDPHRVAWIAYGLTPAALGLWLWRERRRALQVLFVALLALGAADLLAYRALKPWIARPRPESASSAVVLRAPAGGAFGFPSNHAANAAAAAAVLSTAYPGARFVFWALAALIAYSRVYCGAHYPGDVLAGLLLGALIGYPWAAFALRGGSARKKRR